MLQSNWNEIADNFDEMNLREDLLRGIYAYGFEKPSAIQQRAIIPCIRGKLSLFLLPFQLLFPHLPLSIARSSHPPSLVRSGQVTLTLERSFIKSYAILTLQKIE